MMVRSSIGCRQMLHESSSSSTTSSTGDILAFSSAVGLADGEPMNVCNKADDSDFSRAKFAHHLADLQQEQTYELSNSSSLGELMTTILRKCLGTE